jgi:hypothetical protein
MRIQSIVALVALGSIASAEEPAPPDTEEETEDQPPPEPEQPPPNPVDPPIVVTPPAGTSGVPPITINITNNNNGNNSNTNTQTNNQQNDQKNDQQNQQTNEQTTHVPIAVQMTVPVVPTPPMGPPRYEVMHIASPQRWFSIGIVAGEHEAGIRGSIDLIARHAWSIGIAGSIVGNEREHEEEGKPRGSAVAYLAWTRKFGPFDIRAQLGLGASTGQQQRGRDEGWRARSTSEGDNDDEHEGEHCDVSPYAEAALLIGLPITRKLSLFGGPVLSASGGMGDERDEHRGREEAEHGDARASLVGGLVYRF